MSPIAALALTLLVEVPLYAVGLVGLGLARPARAVALGVVVNLATQPALWWLLAPAPSLARLAGAEAAVCAVEAALLCLALRTRSALIAVVSVGVNAASVLAGLAVSQWVVSRASGGG
jgi:hypothetical protein